MEVPSSRKYNLRSASSDGDEDHALSLDDLNSSADSKDSRNRHHSAFSLAPSTGRFVLLMFKKIRPVSPCIVNQTRNPVSPHITMIIHQRVRRSV